MVRVGVERFVGRAPGAGRRRCAGDIDYNRLKDGVIYLLIMYAKGVKDSIPAKTLNMIRETING